jgi:hypothetical protein
MTRERFESIKRCFRLHPENTDYTDPWFPIRDFVLQYNEVRKKLITPGTFIVVDECMSMWHGKDLPHLTYIPRKPEPYGVELKSIAEVDSGVIMGLEVQVHMF